MSNYRRLSSQLSNKSPMTTPQTEPTPGTVKNNAGGYVFEITIWDRLDRFLILGADGPTYYCTEKKMVLDNAKNVLECIKNNGIRTVDTIVAISDDGRAPKNSPALFALAMCASMGDEATKRAALAALPKVARIGTHLFQFAHYVDGFRGWGTSLRNAFNRWYNEMSPDKLALQIIKYPQRTAEEGNTKSKWSHDDLLRKCHPKGDEMHNLIYQYITKEGKLPEEVPDELRILEGANLIKSATSVKDVVNCIEEYGLPHELIPKEFANNKEVWNAVLPHLPVGATLRVLNRLTAYGVVEPLSHNLKTVVERITDQEQLVRARVHPIAVLAALKTYNAGCGVKGSLTWNPNARISQALNEALYLSFKSIKPTNKNILIGLDVSGSMTCGRVGGLDFVTPREASAVMAMVTARSESNYHMIGFTSSRGGGGSYNYGVTELNITPNDRLDAVCDRISRLPMGATDCARPVLYARDRKMHVDAFITYTDNETWAGPVHVHQALKEYRNKFNPTAKLIAVGMTATEYSIADPNDPFSMNVVGFDTSAPAVMADFIRK